jgi:tight adherence protein C
MPQLASFSLSDLAIAALGMAGFAVLLFLWLATGAQEAGSRRIGRYSAQRQALTNRGSESAPRLAPAPGNLMRRIITRLDLLRTDRARKAALLLASAGWRGSDALIKFMFAKLVLPMALGLGSLVYMNLLHLFSASSPKKALVAMGVTLLGFFLPDLFVKNSVTKRQTKIQKQLPDFIDLMVTCTEAGLSLDMTFKRAAAEFVDSAPELADEIAVTSAELDFLSDRNQALVNLADRVGLPSVRALVTTLQQSAKFGTPLAEAMRVLAQEFRDERILKAEEKAARLPAMMTVPLVIFILPPLLIVLIGPAVLHIYDAFVSMK